LVYLPIKSGAIRIRQTENVKIFDQMQKNLAKCNPWFGAKTLDINNRNTAGCSISLVLDMKDDLQFFKKLASLIMKHIILVFSTPCGR